MPGVVTHILVTEGQVVAAGEPLFVLEAMKMETVIRAAAASVVTSVRAVPGARVDGGAIVVEVDRLPGDPK
jgi:pyruvate carboxylase subunit B